MTQEEKTARLNALGEEYCTARRNGEKCQERTEEIFLAIDDLFHNLPSEDKKYMLGDAIGEFFVRDWASFDAEKGDLCSFVKSRLELRRKDMDYKDRGFRKVKIQNPDAQETRKYRRAAPDSLDRAVDENRTLMDQYADTHSDAADLLDTIFADTRALELLTLILHLRDRLGGRARNEQRINYYRLFFTDSVVDILHHQETPRSYIQHERDLFDALKKTFLHFFMCRECETIAQIRGCPMKRYGEVVDGRPLESMGHPLPNDVYITYLNTAEGYQIHSPGTISNQRKEYQKFLRENLC